MRDYNVGGKVRPAEDEEGDTDLSSLMAYYKPSTYTPNYFSGGMSPMSFPAPTSMPRPPSMWNYNVGGKLRNPEDEEGAEG